MRHLFVAGVLACVCAWASAWPTLSLSFTQAHGAVTDSEAIPVWVSLHVDAAGPALSYAPNAGAPFGLAPADLPLVGLDIAGQAHAFTSYTSATLSNWYGCSGSFTHGCADGAYHFDFNPDLWAGLADAEGAVTLAPGQSVDLLWGSFVPQGGGAAPGEYTFYRASLGLSVTGAGLDDAGAPVALSLTSFPFQTCGDGDRSCAFSRTVSAVPEASSPSLLAAGLLALMVSLWGRRPQTTTGSGSRRMPKRP